MQDLFELTPELLLEQSQELFSLCSAYENLFSNISTDLNGINSSWSDLLSNNFSGKIGSAQKAFTGALSMLQNSANSARSVAETAQEMDTAWASKIGGTMYNPDILSYLISSELAESMRTTLKEDWENVQQMLGFVQNLKEKMQGKLSSAQEAWIEEIEKLIIGGTGVKTMKITEKVLEGDYHGAFKDGAKAVLGSVLKEAVKEQMGSTGGFVNEGDVAKYYLNLGWGIGTAGGDLAMDPSWKNLGKLAWNATVQPVLDTAGSKIESVIKQIPGISEYYYDEHGAEDIGDVAGVALGDFYGLFSADEGIKEYASNYYKDGIWEGLWGGFEDIGSYIKDSGGVGAAAKGFFDTAWKDTQANWSAFVENMNYLFKAETPEPVNVPLDSTYL